VAFDVAQAAPGVDVVVVSSETGEGLGLLATWLRPGRTVVLLGQSGVGKSTLVNAFLGEDRMATEAIREGDDQGRHTTSHRQLVLLPGGGLILDTPGIREVGLIDADEGVSAVFDDIERLAEGCRFNDCNHANEPGCAILAALDSGALDPARWAHFQKLGLELAAVEQKAAQAASDAERRRLAPRQRIYRAESGIGGITDVVADTVSVRERRSLLRNVERPRGETG